jgi:hypothetical protein
MEDLLSQVTDAKAAIILLALINAVPDEGKLTDGLPSFAEKDITS